jgi:hypothetical protein
MLMVSILRSKGTRWQVGLKSKTQPFNLIEKDKKRFKVKI